MPTKNYPIEACINCGDIVEIASRDWMCATMERRLEDVTTIPDWCPLEDA